MEFKKRGDKGGRWSTWCSDNLHQIMVKKNYIYFFILQGKDYVGEKYSRQGKISQLFTLVLAIGMEITICKYANDSVFYEIVKGMATQREMSENWVPHD